MWQSLLELSTSAVAYAAPAETVACSLSSNCLDTVATRCNVNIHNFISITIITFTHTFFSFHLITRISFLEEHIRDIELQTEERKGDDERRFKESMARLEREKSQELEKYVSQIIALQKELFEAKEEVKRHQQTIDNLQSNKLDLESIIREKESEIESLNEEMSKLKDVIRKQSEESHANSTLIEALNHEVATIKQSSDLTKLEHHRMVHESEVNNINVELEKQVRSLKEENHSLKESNEELTAQLLNNHLIEGKSLLKEGEAISSLANEISDLNIEQVSLQAQLSLPIVYLLTHNFTYSSKRHLKSNRMLMQSFAPTSTAFCYQLWKTTLSCWR